MTPDINNRTEDTRLAANAGGSLAATGMILLMLAGFVLNVNLLFSSDTRPELATHSIMQLLDGTASNDIAGELADTALAEGAAHLQRAANWLVLGDLGPKVRQGCTGWLFLAEELAVHPEATRASAARLEQVINIQKALVQRGITLFVAIVPDKSRIMASHLCALQRPATLGPRASQWVEQLQQHGVSAIDLTAALATLPDTAFLRNDTHWSQAGAEIAAIELVKTIKTRLSAAPEPRQTLTVVTEPARPWEGDLVRLAGIDWLPYWLQPVGENVTLLRFKTPHAPDNSTLSEDDLFGDTNLPSVALIGTSFSRTSHFADFLAQALQTPIANLAKDGGSFSGAAHAYFQSAAFTQTPPKLLVWEIPERDLETPLSNEKAFSIDMADSSQ